MKFTQIMSISEHITFNEAVYSDTAIRNNISNIPNDKQTLTMITTANHIFEPVREHFGCPIYVSSFFRSKELNTKIGGAKSSQHLTGEAFDLDADVYKKIENVDIYLYIKENLSFDQLIFEQPKGNGDCEWVHVSYIDGNNRGQVLIYENGKYTKV